MLAQRQILRRYRQVAMQRQHQRRAIFQRRLGAADFRHAGKKHQNIARMRRQRLAHRPGRFLGNSRAVGMSRLAWRTSTGNILPSLSITGASSRFR